MERQSKLLEALGPGARLENETRAWDAAARRTRPMRDKETALDYRFLREPNLPPLRLRRSRSPAAAQTPAGLLWAIGKPLRLSLRHTLRRDLSSTISLNLIEKPLRLKFRLRRGHNVETESERPHLLQELEK